MRIALLLVLALASTGCWKEIHEASAPRTLDRSPAVADAAAVTAHRV